MRNIFQRVFTSPLYPFLSSSARLYKNAEFNIKGTFTDNVAVGMGTVLSITNEATGMHPYGVVSPTCIQSCYLPLFYPVFHLMPPHVHAKCRIAHGIVPLCHVLILSLLFEYHVTVVCLYIRLRAKLSRHQQWL